MDNEQTALKDREPVALIATLENGIRTFVLAMLAMALAFNWFTWTSEQNAAVLAVVAAAFVLVSSVLGVIVRQKVTPTKSPRSPSGRRYVEASENG